MYVIIMHQQHSCYITIIHTEQQVPYKVLGAVCIH